MTDPKELADRYVALWNEPDPARRRAAVADLFAEDATHILQPPEEMVGIAARIGGLTASLESRGHAELETRAASAYEEFIAPGNFRFRRRDNVERLANAVKFNWEMVSNDGEVAGVGLEFLMLDPDGRIRRDYQFIES